MSIIQNPATGLDVGDPDRMPLDPRRLPARAEIDTALKPLILSASGWRKVFAAHSPEHAVARWARPGSAEDSLSPVVAEADIVLAAAMAKTFGEFVLSRAAQAAQAALRPAILLGMDSRPTGPALADAFARTLIAMGIEVRHLFVVAAPEIMAYAGYAASLPEGHPERVDAFAYISASHNPPGHNGVKFGHGSGGVLPGALALPLIARFRELIASEDLPRAMCDLMAVADRNSLRRAYIETTRWKRLALSAYTLFSHRVVTGKDDLEGQGADLDEIADACAERPLGVVADLNGSARCLSLDRDWLEGLNVRTHFFGDTVGVFSHRIVPEGASLNACKAELESLNASKPEFELGYCPDCDGDRGNLVWFDRRAGKARILEAQEVFALCCISELAGLSRNSGAAGAAVKAAIAVNDATSMRIELIAARFGARVFRAETGEANVIGLADRLRSEGWTVRILGEGSNGGNITHPSQVRDPLATLGALLKLLRLRDGPGGRGLFRAWLEACGKPEAYDPEFSLGDIIASLPEWASTSVFETRAALKVASADKAALKARYRNVFLREWESRRGDLGRRYGISSWRAFASDGSGERDCSGDFAVSGSGGLRIVFESAAGGAVAFIWMRGSGTEPVFRIMADVDGGSGPDEEYFLSWQAGMVREADAT